MTNDVYFTDSEFSEIVYRLKNGAFGKLISGYGPGWKSVAVHHPGPGPVAVKVDYEKFSPFTEVVKAVKTAVTMDSFQFSILQLFWKNPDRGKYREQLVITYIQLLLGIQEFQLLLSAFNREASLRSSSPLGVWDQRVRPLVNYANNIAQGQRPENQVQISWGDKAQQQILDAVKLLTT
ncbi:MAG: hypothetical protein ACREBU_19460 [Nitrososphaera sp.]